MLGGLWAGAWYYGAGIAERTIDGWKAREAQAGRVYTCATQTIGGFPFGIELRCADAGAELKSNQPPLALKAQGHAGLGPCLAADRADHANSPAR